MLIASINPPVAEVPPLARTPCHRNDYSIIFIAYFGPLPPPPTLAPLLFTVTRIRQSCANSNYYSAGSAEAGRGAGRTRLNYYSIGWTLSVGVSYQLLQ